MSLPNNFSTDALSVTNRRKLEWFYRRYVEEFYPEYRFGHFLLAAYAAVPALLTPDLLYKLWQNFHQYQWAGKSERIHRVAVSDLLLSPLCREVGYELYEMEPSIRTALLGWQTSLEQDVLWKERLIPHVRSIATFLLEYHQQPNPARQRWGATYEELQEWNALAFTQAGLLQQKIWQKLQQAVAGRAETETLRVLDFWSKAGQQAGFALPTADQQEWQRNAHFAQAWKALLQYNTQAFTEAIKKDPAYLVMLNDRPEGGIAVQMPAAVKAELDILAKPDTPEPRRRAKTKALLVGVNEYQHTTLPRQKGCVQDVAAFQRFLERVSDDMGMWLELQVLLDKEATIRAVWTAVNNSLADLEDENGDYFVFFFAGTSANTLMTSPREKDGTLFLYDSQPAGENWSGLRQEELENAMFDVLKEKAATCLLVLDHPKSAGGALSKGGSSTRRSTPEGLRGSLIIIYGADTGEATYERFLGENMRGVFPFALLSVLEEKGVNLNFLQLVETTRLRMTQLIDRQTPQLEAFPPEMDHALLFSPIPEKDTSGFYSVYFDTSQERFLFSAGTRQGITPSLEFMATAVKLEDGRTLLVDEVFQNYSTLRNFTGDGDTEKVYPATILQTALPKIRVAFDPGIDEKMEAQLRSVIQSYSIHYIDIRTKAEEAQYFIHSWQNNYFLARHTSTSALSSGSIKPLFNLEPDPFELIKQMEYIAQWSGVLEYQKPRTELDRNDILLEIKLFDGRRSGLLTEGKAEPTSIVQDPQGISLRDFQRDRSSRITKYSAPPGMNFRSGFRLRIIHQGERSLYVQALYLDNSYGIKPIGQQIELHPHDNVPLFEARDGEPSATFLVDFPVKYLDLGITEVYDYLKILVSVQPINIGALEQESLQLDREVTRTTIYRQQTEKDTFTIGDTDWLAITIPIRIRYSESSMEDSTKAPPESDIEFETNIPYPDNIGGSANIPPLQPTPNKTAPPDRGKARRLIAEGDLDSALEQVLIDTKNSEHENVVIQLSARLRALERDNQRGLISEEEYRLSRNRITFALLQILDSLDAPPPA